MRKYVKFVECTLIFYGMSPNVTDFVGLEKYNYCKESIKY